MYTLLAHPNPELRALVCHLTTSLVFPPSGTISGPLLYIFAFFQVLVYLMDAP